MPSIPRSRASGVPRSRAPDSTLALALEGHEFIARRCRRMHSDLFETRLLGARTVCMLGEDAARVFYDGDRFTRAGAMPARVKRTLTGSGGVQGLDGAAHRARKGMLLSLMTPEAVAELAEGTARQWRDRIAAWEDARQVALHDETARLLCRAVCAWAGVPLPEADVERRTGELLGMIDAAAAAGPRHWRGRLSRRRAERWLAGVVERARSGSTTAAADRALQVVAFHRDPGGELLPPRVAAVELLNVLRPTVAISYFVTYAALALHDHPEWREKLRAGGEGDTERFVQEVRRFYPLFPVVAARVRRDFEWRGARFPRGRRVLLDLHGTNHDPRIWDEPGRFCPDRFERWDPSAFGFVPQGGGEHWQDHRCAGEWVTIALMKTAVAALTGGLAYDVPPQDLRLRRGRLPPLPRSRLVITDARRFGAARSG